MSAGRKGAGTRNIPASLILHNLMVLFEYWCPVAIYAASALESSDTELKQHHPFQTRPASHAKFTFKAFSKLLKLLYIRSMGEGGTVCDANPDVAFRVTERWIGWMKYGELCNHWVMEPERDKDVPNNPPPPCTQQEWCTALGYVRACPCFWKMR